MKIVIFKKTDKFIATLYNISQNFKIKKYKTSFSNRIISIVKTVELTKTNLNDFIKFENEINFVKGSGCTTTNWYDMRGKNLNIQLRDGTCMWNGFYYLRKSIFGETD